MMMRYLLLFMFVLAFGSCNRDNPVPGSTCFPDVKNIRRGEYVVDFPLMYRTSGGLINGGQLHTIEGSNAWSACNLPEEFKKDSLDLFVTGYFLTWPGLELMNLSPVPFEVTSAKLR